MPSDQRSEKLRLIVDPEERDIFPAGNEETRRALDIEAPRRLADEEPSEDRFAGPAPPRRAWVLALALVVVVGFAGVVWYAYDWGVEEVDTARLPLILANPEPIKSKPESPGGIEVPHQDKLVLNQAAPDPATPQVERLLPPPEVPKPPPAPAQAQVELETAAGPQAVAAEIAAPSDEAPAAAAEPAPAVPAQTQAAAEPAPRAPETETTPPAEPSQEAEAEPTPPAPKPAERAAQAKQTAARASAGGAFLVQLAAFKSRAATEPAWTRLQAAHPQLLGTHELRVQSVDLGDRGVFYRVQAGYFAERAEANGLCAALEARGQDCLVVRR